MGKKIELTRREQAELFQMFQSVLGLYKPMIQIEDENQRKDQKRRIMQLHNLRRKLVDVEEVKDCPVTLFHLGRLRSEAG